VLEEESAEEEEEEEESVEEEVSEVVAQVVAPIAEPEPVAVAPKKKTVVRRKKTVGAGEGA